MLPNQGMHRCAFKCKQTQPWSNNYMHNYSTVKNDQLTLKHQICFFLECTIFSCIQISISMMSTWVIWAFELIAPGEHVFRNQLQSRRLSWTLLCARQLNYIMNTEHRLSQSHTTLTLFLKERKKEREICSSCLSRFESFKEIRSNAFDLICNQPGTLRGNNLL